MAAPTPNGSNVAGVMVKELGKNPSLLALVVLVGVLVYVFGERISARIDALNTQIQCHQQEFRHP